MPLISCTGLLVTSAVLGASNHIERGSSSDILKGNRTVDVSACFTEQSFPLTSVIFPALVSSESAVDVYATD